MPKYVSLTTWAGMYYDNPPTPGTLRRWARDGNIYPPPELQGREYQVEPDAFYIKPKKCGMKFEQHQPNGRIGRKSPLLERLLYESEKKL